MGGCGVLSVVGSERWSDVGGGFESEDCMRDVAVAGLSALEGGSGRSSVPEEEDVEEGRKGFNSSKEEEEEEDIELDDGGGHGEGGTGLSS